MAEEIKLAAKPVSASKTEQVQILLFDTMNGDKRLFGGRLMEWIDIVAAVTARRHSGHNVTTATVDTLQFTSPAYINDTVILQGYVTYVGRTSMEICVRTFVEALDGSRREINKAYLVMVAIDGQGKPVPVPPLLMENDDERREYAEALKRREFRDIRRRENF